MSGAPCLRLIESSPSLRVEHCVQNQPRSTSHVLTASGLLLVPEASVTLTELDTELTACAERRRLTDPASAEWLEADDELDALLAERFAVLGHAPTP